MRLTYAAAIVLGLVACQNTPPARPAGVPTDAVWAGGVDGGNWLRCRWEGKEPAAFFWCEIYSDFSGDVVARGTYVLAERTDAGQWKTLSSLQPALDYEGFDGVVIYLGGARSLVPDGDIDYPFANGGGKRVRYHAGEQEGEEIEYGAQGAVEQGVGADEARDLAGELPK